MRGLRICPNNISDIDIITDNITLNVHADIDGTLTIKHVLPTKKIRLEIYNANDEHVDYISNPELMYFIPSED